MTIHTIVWTIVCPEGYNGTNCSEVCYPPTYGPECKQTCNCSSCHHIYGCNTTSGKEGELVAVINFY